MKATNRKPENVLPTILLSMQAKQKMDTPQQDQESMVSAVASKVPNFKGTTIQKSFVASRLHSWQAHLQRISPFLQYGEGVWWKQGNTYQFLDADEDPDNKPEGPPLLHFRSSKLHDVQIQSEMAWNYILEKGISLPHSSGYLVQMEATLAGDTILFLHWKIKLAAQTHQATCLRTLHTQQTICLRILPIYLAICLKTPHTHQAICLMTLHTYQAICLPRNNMTMLHSVRS